VIPVSFCSAEACCKVLYSVSVTLISIVITVLVIVNSTNSNTSCPCEGHADDEKI